MTEYILGESLSMCIVVVIDTMKQKTETLIEANKEIGLEVSTEKTEYMLLSGQQNAGQNCDINIANRSFENVAQFKYLGTTATNQNLSKEEIKGRLYSSNACYHSVQNFLFPRLPSKNVKSEYKNYNFACSFVWV
jgi:hypothetical protein